jgi:calcium-dependent protein kinase
MDTDDLQMLMQAADIDGNGIIDYEEFVAATINLNKLEREENCLQAFKHFDRDGSGFITADEVEAALQGMGKSDGEDVTGMIKQYDSNNDGKIDYAEFVSMLRKGNDNLKQASSFFKTLNLPQSLQQF